MSIEITRKTRELLDLAEKHPEILEEMKSYGMNINLDMIEKLNSESAELFPDDSPSPEESLTPSSLPPIQTVPTEEVEQSSTAVDSIINSRKIDKDLFKVKQTNVDAEGNPIEYGVMRKTQSPISSLKDDAHTGYDWKTEVVNDKSKMEILQTPTLLTRDMDDDEIAEYAEKIKQKKQLEKEGYFVTDINSDEYQDVVNPTSMGDPFRRGIKTTQQAIGSSLNIIPSFIPSPQNKWVKNKVNSLLMNEDFISETKDSPNRYKKAKEYALAEWELMASENLLSDEIKEDLKDREDFEIYMYNLGKYIQDYWGDAWASDKPESERGFFEDLFTADEATGRLAEAPENFLDYLDPSRVLMTVGETAPMMGMFMATTIAHPIAGTALMFGIEGGSAKEGIIDYERATGKRVPENLRDSIPIMVGSFNAVLEKFGLDRIMKGSGVRSRILNILAGAKAEGTTEGLQELNQILAQQLTQEEKEVFQFTEEDFDRIVDSYYAGFLMGKTASTVANTLDVEGRLMHDMAKKNEQYEEKMSKNDSWIEVNRALDEGDIDKNMATTIKHFLIKNPEFDTSSILNITKETRLLIKDEWIKEKMDDGLSKEEAEDAYRIWAESEEISNLKAKRIRIKGSTVINDDINKTTINLYAGADITTVIEELYGALYKGLPKEEKDLVEKEFRENESEQRIKDLDNELERFGWSQLLNEHFQKRGLKWYTEEGVKSEMGALDRIVHGMGVRISDYFSKLDNISKLGDNTMKMVQDFSEGAKQIEQPIEAFVSAGKRETFSAKEIQDTPNKINKSLHKELKKFAKSKGLKYSDIKYPKIDREKAMAIADDFDKMENNIDAPGVREAYEAMANETKEQWDFLESLGYTMEPWLEEGQPYKSSKDMLDDVLENKHVYFFLTEEGFGEGQDTSGHPLLESSGVTVNGKELVYNDLFRAVHDIIGHSRGNQFGPRGEETAWREHIQLFSDTAKKAVTTETRGQNSWVNFGRHLRGKDGKLLTSKDKGFIPAPSRPYAEQKVGILSEESQIPYKETFQAEPIWESKISKASKKLMNSQKSIKIQSIPNTLKKMGVSEEEIEWAQVKFLSSLPQQDEKLSTEELHDYILESELKVEEVTFKYRNKEVREKDDSLYQKIRDLHRELSDELEKFTDEQNKGKIKTLQKDIAEAKKEREILRDEHPTPKFRKWTLPVNPDEFELPPVDYKELLITIPQKRIVDQFVQKKHFDVPNVVAFIRFDSRMKDGKRILFINEIQSDWHTEGQKKGYRGSFKPLTEIPENYRYDGSNLYEIFPNILPYTDTNELRVLSDATKEKALAHINRQLKKDLGKLVPNAPFKQNWLRLAQRRMLKYAVDNGFDSVEWMTGEESADMYDVRKQIDAIHYKRLPSGAYKTSVEKDGEFPMDDVTLTENKLESYFSKSIAQQIVNGEGSESILYGGMTALDAKDMVVGGKFHATFYNKKIPSGFQKLIKRFGGKVSRDEFRHSIDINPDMVKGFSEAQETFQAEVMPPETSAEYIQRKLQDKLNRLKKGQKILKIEDDDMDAYLHTELYLSKVRHQLDKNDDEVNEILEEMTNAGLNLDDIGTFLYAQHAPERDEYIKSQSPDTEHDASGWDNEQMGGTQKSYMPGGKNYKKGSKKIANKIRSKIINKRLNILYNSGLITEESYNSYINGDTFKHYVPLKGIASAKEFTGTGRGFNLTGKDIMKTRGRSTVANNPLTQLLEDLEQTVIRAEKNEVAQSLYKLVEENEMLNPDGTPYWEVKNIRYRPSYDKDGEMQSLIPENLDTSKEMIVYFDGKPKKIVINDKILYDNLNNLGQGKSVKFLQTAMNTLRHFYTTVSPTFWITNFQRDSMMNALMHLSEGRADIAGKTLANIPKAKFGIASSLMGKKGKWVDVYEDFLENGGKIGWVDPMTIEERTADLEKRISNMTSKNPIKSTVKATFSFIENINTIFESSTRLATYKALIDSGYSKKRASQIAKNITVNFNKKGEMGIAMNSAYLFANASIQGGFNVARAFMSKRGMVLFGSLASAGYMMSTMMREDDEDEYDKINDYNRFTKLMVPKPDKGYFPIQLPYGFNFPYGVGVILEEMTNGDVSPEDASVKIINLLATTFSPMQGSDIIDAVTPTLGKPAVQWWRNKKYHGGKIKPDDKGSEKIAPSRNYYDSANPLSIAFAEKLNEISGGTDIRPGKLSVSPNNIDGIIEWFGPLINGLYDTMGGKEWNNMNLKKLVHIEPGDYKPQQMVYDIVDKSKNKTITAVDWDRFDRYMGIAINSGVMTSDDQDDFVDKIIENQKKVSLPAEDASLRADAIMGHKKMRKHDVTEEQIKTYTDILEMAYDKELISKGEYKYRYKLIDRAWDKIEKDN